MRLFRARIFSPVTNPFATGSAGSYLWHEDGFLAIDEDGTIAGVGDWPPPPPFPRDEAELLGQSALIVPGFVDTHLHAPQLEMIGSYGGHLLEWLQTYTFPTEMRFEDPAHARGVAAIFYRELLRNGTTCALVFSTVHTEATRAFFEEAERIGIRAIVGKTLMDRNAPDALLQEAGAAFRESRELILEWRRRSSRIGYAVTPRFAPTSTPALLEAAGRLLEEFPDLWVHTHISENVPEVRWVRELFPEAGSYADVYDRYGLLRRRTVLAHGVHLSDDELSLLAERESAISHCPNSNLFLGSGLFPLRRVIDAEVNVGLGSDIGAGTTPSIIGAMADAYKVQRVRGVSLDPFQLFYLATLGGAGALRLDRVTGSLQTGRSADFVVLDLRATELLALRTDRAETLEDLLAGVIFMGDDRVVARTYVEGRELWRRTAAI